VENIEIDTWFRDKPAHIEISTPMGVGGATYFITINNFHQGSLLKSSNDGWRIHLHPTTILQGDDVAVIIELIERDLM
jgi:hypothetical protein